MNPYNAMYSKGYVDPYQLSPSQPDTNMIWVDGKSNANMFPVQNGKSVTMFDKGTNRFFIKTVDLSGMPQRLRSFVYEEEIEKNENETPAIDTSMFVTKDDLKEILASLNNEHQQQPVQQQQNNGNNNQGRNGNKNGKSAV